MNNRNLVKSLTMNFQFFYEIDVHVQMYINCTY